jgi:hypothetical protein
MIDSGNTTPRTGHRLFNGIDTGEDVVNRDLNSFRFHGPVKAHYYRLLKFIPYNWSQKWYARYKGLIHTVMKIINPPPKDWIEYLREHGSPNDKALVRILDRYLEKETQEWRREVIRKVFPFLICLTAKSGDPNYYEVRDWMIYQICREYELGNLEFNMTDIMPINWWNEKKRGRGWIKIEVEGKETTNKVILGGIV